MRLLVLLAALCPALAADGEVSQRQVLALIRALSYDRLLADRVGPELRVAILYTDDPRSRRCALSAAGGLEAAGELTVQDRPLRAEVLHFQGLGALDVSIHDRDYDVLMICEAMGEALPGLLDLSREHGLTSAGFVRDYAREGVALVVSEGQAGLEVHINLPASRAEGMHLSSDLLKLATVVRELP